jgi:hypothetical protein
MLLCTLNAAMLLLNFERSEAAFERCAAALN